MPMAHQLAIFKGEVARYPRLDTVLMIEEAVRKSAGRRTAYRIWRELPKKVMWKTFLTTLDYLAYSGKILVEPDKTITWVWNPRLMRQVKRGGVEA